MINKMRDIAHIAGINRIKWIANKIQVKEVGHGFLIISSASNFSFFTGYDLKKEINVESMKY